MICKHILLIFFCSQLNGFKYCSQLNGQPVLFLTIQFNISHFRLRFGLVGSLCFNGISTLCRLLNAKATLLEEQLWYYLTHSWEDKGVHTFPKGICPKVNVIARLESELAYYDSAVHRYNHYTTWTPRLIAQSLNVKQLTHR